MTDQIVSLKILIKVVRRKIIDLNNAGQFKLVQHYKIKKAELKGKLNALKNLEKAGLSRPLE